MSEHKRQDVQGLRAVAVPLVVAFHAGLPVPSAGVGFDVFPNRVAPRSCAAHADGTLDRLRTLRRRLVRQRVCGLDRV